MLQQQHWDADAGRATKPLTVQESRPKLASREARHRFLVSTPCASNKLAPEGSMGMLENVSLLAAASSGDIKKLQVFPHHAQIDAAGDTQTEWLSIGRPG